jgi:hypothetical protein
MNNGRGFAAMLDHPVEGLSFLYATELIGHNIGVLEIGGIGRRH